MENVPRYECEQSIQGGKPIANFKLSKAGGWVHFTDIKEFLPTAHNKPSAKCYSILCPAIWHNYCTSSKYNDCLDNQVE
jgi:hypothetical protein